MGKSNLFEHYDGISRALSEYSSILGRFNNENYNRILESVSRNLSLNDTLSEISLRQKALFDSLESPLLKYEETMDMVSLQWDALGKIAGAFKTPEIDKLQKSLMQTPQKVTHLFHLTQLQMKSSKRVQKSTTMEIKKSLLKLCLKMLRLEVITLIV